MAQTFMAGLSVVCLGFFYLFLVNGLPDMALSAGLTLLCCLGMALTLGKGKGR